MKERIEDAARDDRFLITILKRNGNQSQLNILPVTAEEAEIKIRNHWEGLQSDQSPACERSGLMLLVKFFLSQTAVIRLLQEEKNGQGALVEIQGEQGSGRRPRACGDSSGLAVSTSHGQDRPYLCLYVFPEDPQSNHPFIDRGLCWVESGHPAVGMVVVREWDKKSQPANGAIAEILRKAWQVAEKTIEEVIGQQAA